MPDKLKSLLRSRRFWLTVAGVLVAVSGELNLGVSDECVRNVVMALAAWVIGDSFRITE